MSSILIQHGEIALRLMQDDLQDYQLLSKWLTDPTVLEFYEGRDNPHPLSRIVEEYSPKLLRQEQVTPCFILYQTQPIGYLQYYHVTEADRDSYGGYGRDENSQLYAIDLFIGESRYWNQGIGTTVLSAALSYLFEDIRADRVLIDPLVSNVRAIRCYEKCGFTKVKQLPNHELHEGRYRHSWLMVAERSREAR